MEASKTPKRTTNGRSRIGNLYMELIEHGVPRIFSWIEWAGFIALLRFVGQKYDIAAISMLGGALMPLLSVHMGLAIANAAVAGNVVDASRRIHLYVTGLAIPAVAFGLYVGLGTLVNALIRAQG